MTDTRAEENAAWVNWVNINHAEDRAAFWLAEANTMRERGNTVKEDQYFAKSQYWLDRANKLRGWGE